MKYKNWWHANVIRIIKAYPELRERKDAIQSQSVTANYTPSPRAGGAARAAENVALRQLAPAEEEALEAVEMALERIRLSESGERIELLIRRYYWQRSGRFLDIAENIGFSERSARRANARFLRAVAVNLRLIS